MGGGNRSPFLRKILKKILRKILTYSSRFSPLHPLHKHNFNSSFHSGGILIEFAFSIPILIVLLLFVCDHYRYYELKSKVKAGAYFAAAMIQQLNNAKTDKQLTLSDLVRITYASSLNLFHTNSMFNPWPLGLYQAGEYFWVKRINQNSYQLQYCWSTTYNWNRDKSPDKMDKSFGSVYTMTASEVEEKYPNLICHKDGEERLLIGCVYKKAYNSIKSKLGLFLIEPGSKVRSDIHGVCFDYYMVITPKPGLFPVRNE